MTVYVRPITVRHIRYILLFLCILIVLGIVWRVLEYRFLKKETEKRAIVAVNSILVEERTGCEEIILPANIQAWHQTTIYARTNGYVKQWYTDIGAQVKKNDLLAEIYAPEVDAQLRETQAQLKMAQANYALAKISADRWRNLLKTASVSQQETDERVQNEKSQAAIVASTRAERDRLQELVGFQKVVAPFDGVIMARYTDIGRLINAGSGTVPLFRIVQSDKLRAYVQVPQNYSSRMDANLHAEFYFPQYPKKFYPARLVSTAKALDPITKTLQVEFVIDNQPYELTAGSYAEAHFFFREASDSVRIPVNSLIFQAQGLQVASISKENTIYLKYISIGRDFGTEVEVVSGLKAGETIVLNPPDLLQAGERIHSIPIQQPKSSASLQRQCPKKLEKKEEISANG